LPLLSSNKASIFVIGIILLLLAIYYYFEPGKKHLAAVFLFALVTAGFQFLPVSLITLPLLGLSKSYDWLLLFLLVIFCCDRLFLPTKKFGNDSPHKMVYAVSSLHDIYSVFSEGIELSVSIRVFRNFVFVLSVFVFCSLSTDDITKTFKVIIWCTSLASVLYCLQVVLGVSLLNAVLDDYRPEDLQVYNGITRYYNTPVFLIPGLFFLLFDTRIAHKRLKWALIFPNVLAIVFAQHRNLILAVLVCVIIFYVVRLKVSVGRIVFTCLLSLILLVGVDKLIDNRLSDGFADLEQIVTNGLSSADLMTAQLGDMSTSEFRFYLFYERINYITRDFWHSLFGIGLITEDSRVVKSLNFNIGLIDDTGGIIQVDTSDIAWSSMIIYFGIAGTIIFMTIYAGFLRRFYALRSANTMMVGFLFIINLLITSFYSVTIISQPTICLLMMFGAYHYLLSNQKKEQP
jgi:hypothetical protein